MARIALNLAQRARGDAFRLIPGMPAEVFTDTGEQTVLAYLLKPLKDHIQRAWRGK